METVLQVQEQGEKQRGYSLLEFAQVDIIIANSVWAQGDVKEDFKKTCQTAFGAQTFPLKGAFTVVYAFFRCSRKNSRKSIVLHVEP